MTPGRGTVLEREGSTYRVATEAGEVRAVLRGRAKREDRDRVVVGDHVTLEQEPGAELAAITAVEPRRNLLARRVPEGRGERPVAANLDRVLVVTAAADPAPVPQLIDRLLVVAEANDIPASVVVNKVDLEPGTALAARCRGAGYEVFETSARSGAGLAALRGALLAHVSLVTGPSGVGKSTLLNAVQPGLALRTGALSARVRRGTHTTVGAVMVPLDGGGFLVDTPGFSEVGLWGLEPRALAQCFPEMRARLDDCRFADCRHDAEPGCAVRAAVADGAIAADRYASYRALLDELEQAPRAWE